MSTQFWWYVARATGMVAAGLLAASVIWGLLLSTRLLERRPSPKWLLDLHRYLGGLAVIFTGFHLAGLVADTYVHFDLVSLFVPMASTWKPGPVAWGVIAMYGLVAVEATSLMMKHLSRKVWHGIHLTSYVVFWMVAIHGATAGTDATNPWYVWGSIVSIVVVLALTMYRILIGKRSLSPQGSRAEISRANRDIAARSSRSTTAYRGGLPPVRRAGGRAPVRGQRSRVSARR
jgi:DMSO/TMAO reductase YedYZ heme-binding membrane subunit